MSRPKAIHLRQGHANTKPKEEAKVIAIHNPDPPPTLGAIGRRVWSDIWTAGARAYEPATDSLIIERYASLQERRRVLLDIIEEEGWLSEGSNGQTVAHPAVRLLMEVEKALTPLEDRLGLSPEARARLGISFAEMHTKLDAFLKEANN